MSEYASMENSTILQLLWSPKPADRSEVREVCRTIREAAEFSCLPPLEPETLRQAASNMNAKAGLGETCDGDSDCAIGYCCACYYDLDDSYGSRYFCDDKASWADSCYGTEAVKILLAKGYSRSSYSDYC